MPRGNMRGAPRGGAPRGGPGGRGTAPRGAPAGRGGPPSAPTRGGASARSRPPAAGGQRMLPTSAMSHQQVPSGSQPKPDGYDEYVGLQKSALFGFLFTSQYFIFSNNAFSPLRVHMKSLMQSQAMKDMIVTTVSSLLQREFKLKDLI